MTEQRRLKIATAVMAYGGQVTAHHIDMWIDFGAYIVLNIDHVGLVNNTFWDINPVDKARNMALAVAMMAEADWLLMIDADTFVARGEQSPGEQLLQMIFDAEVEDAAIVVAPVATRTAKGYVMAYRLDDERTTKYPSGRLQPIALVQPNGLERIDSAAAAVMAINLKHVGDARFAFVEETETQVGYSEDHEFCRQIREASGKILCDTRVATGHLGRPPVLRSSGDPPEIKSLADPS